MQANLIPLSKWIESQFKSYSTPPRQQKEEIASELGIGVATVYRWLKEGNRYIEETGADISGENGPVMT
ncbi:MAG: helix-turn-helix domain-containing protein [Pseudomonadota bacterium]